MAVEAPCSLPGAREPGDDEQFRVIFPWSLKIYSDVAANITLAHPRATHRAIRHLRRTDPVLGKLMTQVGACRYQLRSDGEHFDHLVRAIVYQQLAGKAAATIYGRLQALYGGRPPTPAELAGTPSARLRRAGLSRQKLGYLKDLARQVTAGRLPLDTVDSLSDEAVIEALTAVRGVGVWTAQMFLMFRLGRLDVLPVLDLGIQKGMRRTYALRKMPKPAQMERIAAGWRPYRSVACWYLWRAVELPDAAPRSKRPRKVTAPGGTTLTRVKAVRPRLTVRTVRGQS